jgi:glycine/D-amino acid oxidase-like deaminating enzyme
LKIDYLIVGQGIAGTLLAYFLQKEQKEIIIVDQYNPSSASMVGAGMFSPITGQRHVKTWMADTLFSFAEKTYNDLEKYLNQSFYHKVNLIKVFGTKEEQNKWNEKIKSGELAPYVAGYNSSGINTEWMTETPFSAELKETGFVEMVALIAAFKNKLQAENRYIEAKLDYSKLRFDEDYICWDDIQAKKIIFCNGYKATQNPLFSWLPFVLTKGDVLTIHAKELGLNKILNKEVFVLPLGEGKYRAGSTYIWEYKTELPECSGKEEIVKKLTQLITCPFSICDHKAGIRPTVKDRKPLIGLHPIHKNAGIFNGLGAKGVTLAPYFANQFAEFLEKGQPLDPSVDIRRFYKYFA